MVGQHILETAASTVVGEDEDICGFNANANEANDVFVPELLK